MVRVILVWIKHILQLMTILGMLLVILNSHHWQPLSVDQERKMLNCLTYSFSEVTCHLRFYSVSNQVVRVILVWIKQHIDCGPIRVINAGVVTLVGCHVTFVWRPCQRRLTFGIWPYQYVGEKHIPDSLRVLFGISIAKGCFCCEVSSLTKSCNPFFILPSTIDIVCTNALDVFLLGSVEKNPFVWLAACQARPLFQMFSLSAEFKSNKDKNLTHHLELHRFHAKRCRNTIY